jgi:hypothetical protein
MPPSSQLPEYSSLGNSSSDHSGSSTPDNSLSRIFFAYSENGLTEHSSYCVILRFRILRRCILARKILHWIVFHLGFFFRSSGQFFAGIFFAQDNSSLTGVIVGKFFTDTFFARKFVHRKILRVGLLFPRKIARQRIMRWSILGRIYLCS